MMDEVVEIRFENADGEQEYLQNLGEIDNLSLGNNRLIIVRENHSFIDPIENDPILSSHISVGNNLALEDWDSQFDADMEEEEATEDGDEEDGFGSEENGMDLEGSGMEYDDLDRDLEELEDDQEEEGEEEDDFVAEGDENPLVGIERVVPTIRNMLPDDQFESYLD